VKLGKGLNHFRGISTVTGKTGGGILHATQWFATCNTQNVLCPSPPVMEKKMAAGHDVTLLDKIILIPDI